MKKNNFILIVLSIAVFAFASCDRAYNPSEGIKIVHEDTIAVDEAVVMMNYLTNSGEYINSKKIPGMVSVEDVNSNLNDYLVIDIRSKELYQEGHIYNAINVKFTNLLNYLENNVSASNYEKIVIACKSGQTGSYATSLLRLVGYNNAYALKYGMNAWSAKMPNLWSKNVSDKYASILEETPNEKDKKYAQPKINTGKRIGSEILLERVKQVFKAGFKNYIVKADHLFAAKDDYYIINYWPESKYSKGHIPGAFQFTPKKSLGQEEALNFVPDQKKVLVYCFTGQHSAFVAAYLRTLGYDAHTLAFGANSFMHSSMVAREGWHGFVASKKIHDFPFITGANPSGKASVKSNAMASKSSPAKAKKKMVKRKKKEVEGGCG